MFKNSKDPERRDTPLTGVKPTGILNNYAISSTNAGLYEALCNINQNLSRIADVLERRDQQ